MAQQQDEQTDKGAAARPAWRAPQVQVLSLAETRNSGNAGSDGNSGTNGS